MLRAIFWKEWRQQRSLLFAILFLTPLVGVLGWHAGGGWRYSLADLVKIVAVCIAGMQAIVTGSLLFAPEVEDGTLAFLDASCAERSRIWRAKMLAGVVIAMPALVLPSLVGGLVGLTATFVGIEMVLVAASVSVFVGSAFRAIGAALLCLFLMSFVVARFAPFSTVGVFGLSVLFVGAALGASWLRFCRTDRERRGNATGMLQRLPATWLTGSLWPLMRRQWSALLAVGVCFVAFAIWVWFAPLGQYQAWALVPAILFVVGCVLGASVFALEQAGAERFLGDQRFPRNRLWLAKIGGWLAITGVMTCLFVCVSMGNMRLFTEGGAAALGRALVLALLGFAAGQFFGIHERRLPAVLVLTLLIAAPIGAAWYAPLFGGAPAWHFALVPCLLLAASRFELRRWTAGEMEGAGHWIRCGLVLVACFAWTGYVLWQRTAVVPDVGAPFVDVARTETPAEQERNRRLAEPANEANRLAWDLHLGHGTGSTASNWDLARWNEPGIELGQVSWTEMPTLFDQVLALGAPSEARSDFAHLVNKAFAGDWSTKLRSELIDEPRRRAATATVLSRQSSLPLSRAAELFFLRSALRLEEGKPEAAIEDFAVSLAIVRHHWRFSSPYTADWIENEMLEAAETLLRRGGGDATFCRRMLSLLNHHAQESPTISESIEAWYAQMAPPPPWVRQMRSQSEGLVGPLFDAPLESMRDDRLQRALCLGLLKAAKEKTLVVRPRLPEDSRPWHRLWAVRYLSLAAPELSTDEWARILSHQTELYDVPFFVEIKRELEPLARSAARLSALRLACAAAIFRHDHGREIASLAELTPQYFPTLPESPYAKSPLVLRRSEGETWKLKQDGQETSIRRTIAAGTQVIEIPGLKFAVPEIKASRGP